jgi:hypothetical protein
VTRPAASLALLDASEPQIRDALDEQRTIDILRLDVAHYRCMFKAMFDSAVAAQVRITYLERRLSEREAELARFTSAAVGVVPEAQ